MAGIGPQLPPHLCLQSQTDVSVREDEVGSEFVGPQVPGRIGPQPPHVSAISNDKTKSYGPALPPGYGADKKDPSSIVIGPSLPNYSILDENNDDDDNDIIGPCLPSGTPDESDSSDRVKVQFEARAEAMKNKLTGKNVDDKNLQRESWMLELPPAIGKNFGLEPRTFRSKAVNLGDQSVWTDTPADRERKRKEDTDDASSAKKKKADVKVPTPEELEMRARVEEYNKNTRPQSLLEMHRSKYKAEETTIRRPFDRDRDLNIHRKDPKEKAKFIEGAKEMNKRFSASTYEDKFL